MTNRAKSVGWNLNFQFGFLPKLSSHLSSQHVSVTANRTPWTRIQFLLPRVSRGWSLSTFFPYHLAKVDPLWKDILLKFPDYWTRVVSQKPTGIYDCKTSNKTHFCCVYHMPFQGKSWWCGWKDVHQELCELPGAPYASLRGLPYWCICKLVPTIYHHRFYAIPHGYLCDVDDNVISKCEVQMRSYIFMIVLNEYLSRETNSGFKTIKC